MNLRPLFVLTLFILSGGGAGGVATAQIDDRAPQQTSLAIFREASTARAQPAVEIVVQTHYLLVSEETRKEIYRLAGKRQLAQHIEMDPPNEPVDLATFESGMKCHQQIRSAMRCNHMMINETEKQSILLAVEQDEGSSEQKVPAMMLVEGKVAETNDVIQHSFLIAPPSAPQTQSRVETFEDGTRLRLLGRREPDNSVHLKVQLTCCRLDQRPDEWILATGSELASVAAAQQVDQTSTMAVDVKPGQSLIIDPHYTVSRVLKQDSQIPILGKIPYLGASLKTAKPKTVRQHLIVLTTPRIVNRQSR